MAQNNWEADKMLDVYIHDYLLKRKLLNSAKAFMTEGKVAAEPVAIDAPGGFLFEWWSVFWDIFIARTNDKHSEAAAAYIEAQQIKLKEQQQLQMQQLQMLQHRNAQLQQRSPNHMSLTSLNTEGLMGHGSASVMAMKMYEERMKLPHSMDAEASPSILDANRMAILKSATGHQGPLSQGNSGSMTSPLQQIQARNVLSNDIKSEVCSSQSQKSLAMDPSSIYGQVLQSKTGLSGPGLNQGASNLPLKGWPLTGIEQLRPSLGMQMQKSNLQVQSQFLMASQQQVLGQTQAPGNIGAAANYGDLDPRRLNQLSRGSMSTKDGQPSRNDASICSPVQSSSPKMKGSQILHSSQQDQIQLPQQQQAINNRKRKQHSSSGPANSTGTGNTVAPSPNSPPSTHTPGDGLAGTSNLQHVNGASKTMLIYGSEGTGGLATCSNMLDDMDHFGDIASLDDNMEQFLSHEGGDSRDIYGTLKQSPTDHQKDSSKWFTFTEFGCIRTRNSKVTCCHFSSDGKSLASAGHDKKVVLWNMDTLQTESSSEEHKSIITDIRFRPNSSQLATASVDNSVRLWDAANPNYSLHTYTGNVPVMSLDFHPKKTDLFCFSNNENEIRYWNINPFACARVFKGGNTQVRFQPRTGQLLAAASDKMVAIFDVEADKQIHLFQGHPDILNYLCWDATGDILASVSQNLVKIWSLTSGECIHEFSSNGNQFHSCVFHPSYATLVVIGGMSSLELWNMADNQNMAIAAHENIISALAQSPVTGMLASASHDASVKLWK